MYKVLMYKNSLIEIYDKQELQQHLLTKDEPRKIQYLSTHLISRFNWIYRQSEQTLFNLILDIWYRYFDFSASLRLYQTNI